MISIIEITKMPVSIITDVIVSHAQIHQFLVAKLGFDILRENGLPSIPIYRDPSSSHHVYQRFLPP